jgi:type I restriction enzyme S subunit
MRLPSSWQLVTISDVVDIDSIEKVDPKRHGEGTFQYIDISSVDNNKKEISTVTEVSNFDAPSRARQVVKLGDILVSTVRPNLNAVALVSDDLGDNCICSTGFAVLRPLVDLVNQDFLFFWVKTESFVEELSSKARGANYPAVSLKDVLNMKLPVPPLEEQQYIVEILQQADELRRLRQDSLAKAEKLASALFLEIFGDPITNLMGWEKKTLKSMGRVQTGNTPPRENKNYYGDYIEWIKTDNINTPSPFLTKAKEYLSEDGLRIGRVVEKDSLLVTCIAGSRSVIGNAAIADRRVAFNQQINSFSPNVGNIIFYYFLFLNSKLYIQGFSTDNMKGMISKSTFEKIELIFPPANLQDDFARKAQYCECIRQECFESKSNLEKIQTQLSSQAFSGVLTEKWREAQTNLNPITINLKTVASAMLVVHGVSRPSKLPVKRGWLLGQLSHFQIRILEKICEQSGYLTEDGLGNLIDELPEDINHNQEQKVRKTLEQLVALGLIVKVSLKDKENGFVTAYRALREGDDSKGRDSGLLEVW